MFCHRKRKQQWTIPVTRVIEDPINVDDREIEAETSDRSEVDLGSAPQLKSFPKTINDEEAIATVLKANVFLSKILSEDISRKIIDAMELRIVTAHEVIIKQDDKGNAIYISSKDIYQLLTLWSWLPVRTTMYQPMLLYTTEEHGCSLTTFYVRVEQHEPTLLMIKTCNNEVFGAYCSSRWCERNQKDDRGNRQAYFGTGETFLFSLYPERAKYPWVGVDGEENVSHGAQLFMAADRKMIIIGGGEGQAIWMDENIRYGKTDHCATFNNPPLCPSGDFEISVLEVYGFAMN